MISGILRRRTDVCFATGVVLVTHFQGCNGIGDLLTRPARNFIYSEILGLSVLYLCLLKNQNNYDLFNMRSLQRVWRCRQTDLVLDKGGVKISTRNRPLSP